MKKKKLFQVYISRAFNFFYPLKEFATHIHKIINAKHQER